MGGAGWGRWDRQGGAGWSEEGLGGAGLGGARHEGKPMFVAREGQGQCGWRMTEQSREG